MPGFPPEEGCCNPTAFTGPDSREKGPWSSRFESCPVSIGQFAICPLAPTGGDGLKKRAHGHHWGTKFEGIESCALQRQHLQVLFPP